MFHIIAEFFSIVVAFGMFMFAWNSRKHMDNAYLLLLGIAYLFIGLFDLLHTLAFKGMNIFDGFGINLATQLWISARSLESISLFLGLFAIRKKLNSPVVFSIYITITVVLLFSIFYLRVFPICYIEDLEQLTPFKIVMEYVISGILLISIIVILLKHKLFTKSLIRLMIVSMVLTILSEMAFTLYDDFFGFFNLLGHYFKILSFYLIYRAIIKTGLIKPYEILFRDLKKREEQYKGIVEDQTELIIRYNPEWEVSFVNKAYCKYFNVKKENILHKRFNQRFANFELDDFKNKARKLTAEKPIFYSESVLTEGDNTRWQDWINRALFDQNENIVEFQLVGRDITKRKTTELQLKKLMEELKYKNEELENFSSVVAHDLKNPLSTFYSYFNLILNEINDKEEFKELQKLTITAQERANTMSKMIDDLLEYSKFFGKIKSFKEVNCQKVIEKVKDNLSVIIHKTNTQIKNDPLPVVFGEESLLIHLFQNLIENAVKYFRKK